MEMDSVGEEVSLWQKMMQYPDSWAEGTLPLRSTMEKAKGKWGQHTLGKTIHRLKCEEAVGDEWDCGLILPCKLIRPEACLLKWNNTQLSGCKQRHSSLACWTLRLNPNVHPPELRTSGIRTVSSSLSSRQVCKPIYAVIERLKDYNKKKCI